MAITFNGETLATGILSPESVVIFIIALVFFVGCLYVIWLFINN